MAEFFDLGRWRWGHKRVHVLSKSSSRVLGKSALKSHAGAYQLGDLWHFNFIMVELHHSSTKDNESTYCTGVLWGWSEIRNLKCPWHRANVSKLWVVLWLLLGLHCWESFCRQTSVWLIWGFEILVARLRVILFNVRSPLFLSCGESGIRSPKAKIKETQKPRTSLEVSKKLSRNPVLGSLSLFSLLFLNWLWVCFSMFSSRNVLEAQ